MQIRSWGFDSNSTSQWLLINYQKYFQKLKNDKYSLNILSQWKSILMLSKSFQKYELDFFSKLTFKSFTKMLWIFKHNFFSNKFKTFLKNLKNKFFLTLEENLTEFAFKTKILQIFDVKLKTCLWQF